MNAFAKSWLLPILLAVASLIVFSLSMKDVTPKASIDLKLSRTDAINQSKSFLESLGYKLGGFTPIAYFRVDGETQLYLAEKYGMNNAAKVIEADSLSTHNWLVWFVDPSAARSQALDDYQVWLSPAGRMLGFAHNIKDTAARRSLTQEEATALAENFLKRQSVSLAGYKLEKSSQRKLTRRTDYDFTWVRTDSALGMDPTIVLRVQGDEIGFYRENLAPKGEFRAIMSRISTAVTFIVSGATAGTFLLFFFIVIFFLKKYHEGEVGVKTAILVFIGAYALNLAQNILQYPAMGSETQLGDLNKTDVRLVLFILSSLIIAVFIQVMVFAGWSVGESYARGVWSKKLSAVDSLLFRKYFTLDVARGILRGYVLGAILLGALTLLIFALLKLNLPHFGIFVPFLNSVPDSFIPGLTPIVLALWVAAFNEIVFRLFFISYLKDKTRRTWPGVVVSSVLFTLTAFTMWDLPFGFANFQYLFPLYLLIGFVFAFIFLKWDLLTAIMTNFVVLAVGYAIPIFSSSGPAFKTQEWIFVGLMAVPLVIAVGGFVRREVFEFTVETTPSHILRISERERMAKELEIARTVQLSLLPKENPHVEGYDIAGICLPALEVGGDYYDFVQLGNGRIGIAIGDVSGKGVPAAIYMTLTKGILQSHAEENISPREVLSKVNKLMYRTIERHTFVSMFYAILDTQKHTMRFARAGHNPAIVAGKVGKEHEFLVPKGMALGLDEGAKFNAELEERETQLRGGDLLVFYTDGFVEAVRRDGEEFGEERLVNTMVSLKERPASEILHSVVKEVRKFVGDFPQRDDMTMVVVRVS